MGRAGAGWGWIADDPGDLCAKLDHFDGLGALERHRVGFRTRDSDPPSLSVVASQVLVRLGAVCDAHVLGVPFYAAPATQGDVSEENRFREGSRVITVSYTHLTLPTN